MCEGRGNASERVQKEIIDAKVDVSLWTDRCSARATRRGSAGSTLIVPAVMVIASISVRGKEKERGRGHGERGVSWLLLLFCAAR